MRYQVIMSNRQTINIFISRDTDSDPAVIEYNKYLSAYNVEAVGDGKFYSIRNILGTSSVKHIATDPTVKEIDQRAANFLIDGEIHKCIVYFTTTGSPGYKFNIFCLDTETLTLYELFEE
jgi:hypothetical protein